MKRNLQKRLSIWALIVAGILMIPFLTKAPWTLGDYIFASIVLYGAAVSYEVIAGKMNNRMHRMLVAGLALGVVMFIWFTAVSGP